MKINFSRLPQLLTRFPLMVALRFVFVEVLSKFWKLECKYSYSREGEDLVIESFLDLSLPGFYVDVGCHDPIVYSNTLRLYSRGWVGLVVDGNHQFVSKFRRIRPLDIPVCALVGGEDNADVIFTVSKLSERSTTNSEFEEKWINPSEIMEKIHGKTVTLQTVFEQYGVPNRFDLLDIDVEGSDFEVLKSFDLVAFRPRIIVIEMHGFRLNEKGTTEIFDYLIANQYELRALTSLNGIFVDAIQR